MVGGMVDDKSSLHTDNEIKTINVSYINNEYCTNTLPKDDSTILEVNSLLDENSLLEKTEGKMDGTFSKHSSINLTSNESSCDTDICKPYVQLKSENTAETIANIADIKQNGSGKIHVIYVEVHNPSENHNHYTNHIGQDESTVNTNNNKTNSVVKEESDQGTFVHNGLVTNHLSHKKPSKKVSLLIHRHTL